MSTEVGFPLFTLIALPFIGRLIGGSIEVRIHRIRDGAKAELEICENLRPKNPGLEARAMQKLAAIPKMEEAASKPASLGLFRKILRYPTSLLSKILSFIGCASLSLAAIVPLLAFAYVAVQIFSDDPNQNQNQLIPPPAETRNYTDKDLILGLSVEGMAISPDMPMSSVGEYTSRTIILESYRELCFEDDLCEASEGTLFPRILSNNEGSFEVLIKGATYSVTETTNLPPDLEEALLDWEKFSNFIDMFIIGDLTLVELTISSMLFFLLVGFVSIAAAIESHKSWLVNEIYRHEALDVVRESD
ncbi:hypothetical protein ACUXV3_17620 [Roseobacteraceae bacterium NS-SX3]